MARTGREAGDPSGRASGGRRTGVPVVRSAMRSDMCSARPLRGNREVSAKNVLQLGILEGQVAPYSL